MPFLPFDPVFLSVDEVFNQENEGVAFDLQQRHRTYNRYYRVISRTKLAGPLAACAAPLLPLPGSMYQFGNDFEWDRLAVLARRSARREYKDDWQSWIVQDFYSTRTPRVPERIGNLGDGHGSDGAEGNPELEWPEIEWDFEAVHRAPRMDRSSRPYVNSATQPFKPAPTVEYWRPTLTVTRPELNYDSWNANAYGGALNSTNFLGWEPGRVMMLPPRARLTHRGLLAFWMVTYKMRFHEAVSDGEDCDFLIIDRAAGNPNTQVLLKVTSSYFKNKDLPNPLNCWQPCILDEGLCRLDNKENYASNAGPALNPSFNKPIPIVHPSGVVHQPVCLDGLGQEAVKDKTTGRIRPCYILFEQYKRQDLNDLFDLDFRKKKRG